MIRVWCIDLVPSNADAAFDGMKFPFHQFIATDPPELSERKCGGYTYKEGGCHEWTPSTASSPTVMLTSPPDDPMSIFVDGNLQPGTYKVQNLASQTYLEVLEHSRVICCRPATVLSPKDALVISAYC